MVILWELRSASDTPAHCIYQHVLPVTHVVTVVVGTTECFREEHRTEADAHEEAAWLLDHFLFSGWIDVAYRDPRLTHI